MAMRARLRKLALSVHLFVSVGWIGAVLVYLALGVTAVTNDDVSDVRAAWIAMDVAGWYVVVPLAVASVATGLLMAFGTKWGLFRHYWVVFSFALTVLAATVLVLHMPDVSVLARAARAGSPAGGSETHVMSRLRGGDVLHPGLGLVVLLAVLVLNVFKPAGLTRHGRRAQRRERDRPGDARRTLG